MNTLEACYELEFNRITFLERKVRITHPKTILTGPPKCGKSYLIFDYLSNFESKDYLYIDFNDIRNNKTQIEQHLQTFVKKNRIKVLILENFDFSFDFPMCDSVIITTQTPINFKRFKHLHLNALEFEEFLLHETRHQNITHSFNQFFKYGNLPQTVHTDETKKQEELQTVLKEHCSDATQIALLKLLFESMDEKRSLHQLFTQLKEHIKISKDRFYALCQFYEQNEVIFFIQKYNQAKATKKIYSYNHGFLTAVSHHKKFKNEFTNMLFLELHSRYDEIYYLDQIDFYIPKAQLLILSIPFFNELIVPSLKKKIATVQKDLNIKEVQVVTINNENLIDFNTLKIQVAPFYEWALA
ncbi:AAA family ATPase [Candidatus Marinarcus aquaticus]|uniref:AAA domain-containing protein n=1 Tax=Candidatus Marinarcus aquaticus TaxID=2044504 RepID=A0A4Q0XU44_9BACT|nr:AAA family ATPase [Candidatus Marinarcus aquaticus]RXJ60643.1 hypothetical protein CRV04_01130 [Candidatus Marinarcus aquaticus]